jgi:acetyl-CoA carboxylase biotin carboxyl carrier protein
MSVDLPLGPDDVADIVAILDGGAYDRLEVRTSRFVLKIARAGEGWTQQWDWSDPAGLYESDASSAAARDAEGDGARGEAPDGLAAIRPPLPGTFYRAPEPGAPPFVEVGDKVQPETVVAIVETMKLMSPVHAGLTGTIEAILVENALMIDGDTVLMHVRLDPS